MKNYLILVIILISLLGCKQKEINIELRTFKNNIAYNEKNKKPFTGYFVRNKDNLLLEKIAYKKGEKDGFHETYYKDSKLKMQIEFKKGIRNGKYSSFYKNGQIYETVNYLNGKENGEYNRFYRTGELYEKITYNKTGEKEGISKQFYKNTNLKTEKYWNEGKLSKEIEYNRNGKKTLERIYSFDKDNKLKVETIEFNNN